MTPFLLLPFCFSLSLLHFLFLFTSRSRLSLSLDRLRSQCYRSSGVWEFMFWLALGNKPMDIRTETETFPHTLSRSREPSTHARCERRDRDDTLRRFRNIVQRFCVVNVPVWSAVKIEKTTGERKKEPTEERKRKEWELGGRVCLSCGVVQFRCSKSRIKHRHFLVGV